MYVGVDYLMWGSYTSANYHENQEQKRETRDYTGKRLERESFLVPGVTFT